ncbi:MAG: hypothetical protein JWN48_2627 [Myxococcaceae bacterium]|nr:hypothetical protein [Myxococcaceae bacterium]
MRLRLPTRAALLVFSTLGCLPWSSAQAGPPPPGHRGPPPEAFTACQDRTEGADCTVSFHDRSLEGLCVRADQAALFCMPNQMPEPPAGERPDDPRAGE